MIVDKKSKGAKRNLRAFFVAGTLLPFLAIAALAERPDPLTNPRQQQMLDAFLAGTPDAADLGDGGGVTAQTLAILGREDLVMHMSIFPGHRRRTCEPVMEGGQPVDPIPYIAARAADVGVTMVNEAHDMPQTRSFAAKIAAALRPEGYSLYAGETFNDGIGATTPPWPLVTDGFFSNEPVYGRLIRSLRMLGYRLLAYEDRLPPTPLDTQQQQTEKRERVQAENLVARIKTESVAAKLLVHVGYSHLNKSRETPVKMMAAHFRDMTGIDPLTVDQTSFWSKTGRYEICDTSHVLLPDPTAIYVGAPAPSFTRHRPNWRLQERDRFMEIPDALRRPSEAAIYEARFVDDPDTAVPVDRILVRPGENDLALLVPPGRYRVAVWTKTQGWSAEVRLTVN